MTFIAELEEEARLWLQAIRAYRESDIGAAQVPELRHRAKTAQGVIGSYVRLRATQANEKSNELIERRLGLDEPMRPPRALPSHEDRADDSAAAM